MLGIIHLSTYFLAHIGSFHQLSLIWASKKSNNKNKAGEHTAQLSLVYRGNVAFLVLSISLWGVTLERIDWFITLTRFLSLILVLLILSELSQDRNEKKVRYLFSVCLLVTVVSISEIIYNFAAFQSLNFCFARLTIFFSFTLIGGYFDKIYQIIKASSVGKQSLIELLFHLSKDLSGIIYAMFVGFEKMWPFVVALFPITILTIVNIFVYLYYQQKENKLKKTEARGEREEEDRDNIRVNGINLNQ